MYPKKPKPKRAVAIPSNLFLENPLREKTFKIGLIARAFAIFRVEQVFIYRVTNLKNHKNAVVLKKILEYMDCPQYIRSKIFKKDPTLKYAGILPPLRTPHHPLKNEKIRYREGIIEGYGRGYILVDVGLKDPVKIFTEKQLPVGRRVSVMLSYDSWGNVENAKLIHRKNIGIYWGYTVKISKSLTDSINQSKADLVIATSRRGVPIQKISQRLMTKMQKARKIILLFGAQKEGLFEIMEKEGKNLTEFSDLVINFIPLQGTKTVRTEEAVFAVLSIVNYLNTLI